ncbi:MAG: hypothetical protein VB957_13585 [Pseudomonadales bacterium]
MKVVALAEENVDAQLMLANISSMRKPLSTLLEPAALNANPEEL